MGTRQVIGRTLVVAGTISLAVGLWHLIDIPACGDPNPCPPGTGKYAAMMAFGIAGPIIGGIVGGVVGLQFVLGIPTMGAMLLLKAFVDREPDERLGLLIAGGIVSTISVLGAVAVFRMTVKQATIRRLYETGSKAKGVITGVVDTGMRINDNPRVELKVRIEPIDGTAPWHDSKTVTVPRIAIPEAGDAFPVWYDPATPTTWAIGVPSGNEEPDAELLAQFGIAPRSDDAISDRVDALERLAALRDRGALTDAEFEREKDRLLDDGF